MARTAATPSRVPVTISTRGPVAVVTVDDGADNTIDVAVVESLLSAFRSVQAHAGAVVLTGRAGCYSVGWDYEFLRSGGEAATRLLQSATEMILRFVEFPRPLVAACTGDALGAAAASLLCCDARIGAAGDYRIGMDFVSRGVPVPDLAVELARSRLSHRHMTMACNTARLYSPDEAVDAGFLDYVTTGDAVEEACEVAADLAERLDPAAFAAPRATICRSLMDAVTFSAGNLWRRTGRPVAASRRHG
ncbi:MAG: enoyl-CoA hydratase-related protein [Acidimicrobiaceae bacterium]|nr:enoyl-CoA hydratase-related protein [Acidimicrobiaceae bacterium]